MLNTNENIKQIENLKKLSYDELKEIEEKTISNPKSTRLEILNICIARGEKEIENNIGLYSLEELEKELESYNCYARS